MKVKEVPRRTPWIAGLLLLTVLGWTGCNLKVGDLIYAGSGICGLSTDACPPDGGHFDIYIVDHTTFPLANPSIPSFDMALKRDGVTVGFAYVEVSPRQDSGVVQLFPDSGVLDYDIMYSEFDTSTQTATTPQIVQTVQRFFGVSLAYQDNAEPAVAYLGGPLDLSNHGFAEAFWYQNDAAIAYRSNGTNWAESSAATDSSPPFSVPTSPPSDNGYVVGFYPALVFQGNNAILAYRDGHYGQSAGSGDWQASDLEMAIGGPGRWTPVAILQAGNNKRAFGAHNRMVLGANPYAGSRGAALVSDRAGSGPDTFGQDLEFSEQQGDGTWKSAGSFTPINSNVASLLGINGADILPNTQAGPSLAYSDSLGYAIAITNRSTQAALYLQCATGQDCTNPANWTTPDPVYQQGSGGWYATVAISPTGDPSVAYYVCSRQANRNEGNCTVDDYVAVANKGASGDWIQNELVVDTGSAFQIRMGFFGNQRVLGYRNAASGVLQIAVEKP